MREGPIFDFSTYTREPVQLSGEWPRLSVKMQKRVESILAEGCYCHHDRPRTATLRLRLIRGNTNVYLQCDACGTSLGGALARAEHYAWEGYPEWDDTLIERYQSARQAEVEARRERIIFPSLTERVEDLRVRRQEYDVWCRTSDEWREIRRLILWRSRGICEACLQHDSQVVHHLTYAYGKLPPAWHLRAVCAACHAKLHNGEDEWCAIGMARDSTEHFDASE